jgi:hypothetical protein
MNYTFSGDLLVKAELITRGYQHLGNAMVIDSVVLILVCLQN